MLRTRLFAMLLLLAAMVAGANTVSASGGCKSYSGSFTAVRPVPCSSLVGICTHGTLVGGFPSTYDFTADTLVPTGNPGEFAYTGHSTITTPQGAELFGSDSGLLTIQPDGTTALFVTTVHIIGGTRQYQGATGSFVAPGTLNLATGHTVGTYSAMICKAEDD
jgi:hypothetical protein